MIHRPLFRLFLSCVVFAVLAVGSSLRAIIAVSGPDSFTALVGSLSPFRAAGAVTVFGPGQGGSGAYVGNGWVLTAAHVVLEGGAGVGDLAFVLGGRTFSVSERHIDPDYNAGMLEHDIALLRLDVNDPDFALLTQAGLPVFVLPPAQFASSIGDPVYLSGVGATTDSGSQYGTRRAENSLVTSIDALTVTSEGGTATTAIGDYGGPVIADWLQIYGILAVNRSSVPNAVLAERQSIGSMVAASRAFIDQITDGSVLFIDITSLENSLIFIDPNFVNPSAKMRVQRQFTTYVADGGTHAFSNIVTGSSATQTFVIESIGTLDLTGLSIYKDGPDAAEFIVSPLDSPSPVQPSGARTFSVQFAPTSPGLNKTATIHILNNAGSPFDITLTGTGMSAADIFDSNPNTLTTAVSAATLAGVEDFESIDLPSSQVGTVNDPVIPGVGNSVMASGTNAATGLWVQSNTGGATAGNDLTARGANGLRVIEGVVQGYTSSHLATENNADSLDLTIIQHGLSAVAVGMNVTVSTDAGSNANANVRAQVFTLNGYLGEFTLTNVGTSSTASFLGVKAPAGESIVRINLSTTAGLHVGVDNVAIYTGAALPAPDIQVAIPFIATLTSGDSLPFAPQLVGTSSAPSGSLYTITNIGAGKLAGLGMFIDGPDAAMFSVSTLPARSPASVLATGGSTSFDLRFTPTSGGLKTATLHIDSSDPDGLPFILQLSGSGVPITPGFSISTTTFNGLVGGLFNAGLEDFGNQSGGVGGFVNDPLEPYVPNGVMHQGLSLLTVQSNTLGLLANGALSPRDTDGLSVLPPESGASGFVRVANAADSLDLLFDIPGATVGAVSLNPIVSGGTFADTASVRMRVYGTSGYFTEFTLPGVGNFNEGSFVGFVAPDGVSITHINLSSFMPSRPIGIDNVTIYTHGAPPQPEIVVERDSANLTDNNPTPQNFGNVFVGLSRSFTFTIRNTGVGTLLTDVTLNGSDAAMFEVTAAPAYAITGQLGTSTFTVRFTPTSAGSKAATLHINNNDSDEGDFEIQLSGTGAGPPPASFTSDSAAFTSSVSGHTFAAIEDFQLATSDGSADDPLAPGVANKIMPTGTRPATGLTAQSNVLGLSSGTTLSPRGEDGLYVVDFGSKSLSLYEPGDSLDLLFDLPGLRVSAVSLNPTASDLGFHSGGPVRARVYGTSGFMGEFTASGVTASTTSSFFGVVAPAGESITRINLASINGTNGIFVGADNIAVYTTAPAGRFDSAFSGGMDSGYDSYVQGLALQPSGHIIAAGKFQQISGSDRNNIGRLNPDGTADPTWTPNFGNDISAVAVQADGNVIVAGPYLDVNNVVLHSPLARLHADGTEDSSFNPVIDEVIRCIAVQNDGKILIGGRFNTVNGVSRRSLARLNSDGTLDTSFDPQVLGPQPFVGYRSSILSIAIQDDGRIIVGGEIESVGGVSREGAARLNSDGTLDASWHPTGLGTAYCLTIQGTTGKCIVSSQTIVLGQQVNHLARLNNDGTADATYLTSGFGNFIYSMAAQSDGNLIFNGDTGTARLLADGAPDPSFDSGAPTVGAFTLAIQADGKVLLAGGYGSFTVDGTTVRGVARMFNDPATHSLTVPSASRVEWLRGGSAPETTQVIFDVTTDHGETYSPLGFGTRISGGWELTGLNLPPVCQVRARARTSGGYYNGSSGLVDAAASFGEAAAPEIVVQKADGTNIADGGTSAFGVAEIGATVDCTFVIRNTGSAALTGIVATVDGANADAFTISTAPATNLGAPSGSTLLTVSFTPTSGGAKTAVLHIASNDTDESLFDITLTGTANSAPVFAGLTINTFQAKVSAISEAKILLRASDADGQVVTITDVAAFSEQGVALTRSGGVITFAAPVAFVGTDSFLITLSDGVSSTQGTIAMVVAGDPGLNPNNPPRLTALDAGAMSVRFDGIPGRSYGIQRSTDLTTWTQIAAPTAAADGSVSITDPSPPQPAAFYRITFPAQ